MKTIYLLAHRLLRYVNKDKAIFALFIIGGVINSMMFAYFYGNTIASVVNRDSQALYYRQYYASLPETYPVSKLEEKIRTLQQNELIESVQLSSLSSQKLMGFTQYVCTTLGETPGVIIMKGRAEYTGEGQVIVPVDDRSPIGSQVAIDGQMYTVIGQHTLDNYYISYADFLKDWNVVDRIYIVSAEKHSYRNDPVESLLYDTLPTDYVRTPRIYELQDEGDSGGQLVVISMVHIVSVISFIFLLRYLIDSLMDENVASLIVGAPKGSVVIMIFWEELILFLAANLIGLLLHYALTPALFSKINISENIVYTAGDYATILLTMLVLTVVCLVPLLRKYTKLSPIGVKRHQT